ncbi:hypothetical protein BD311DRAFT_361406 [Dichomitus squalens]|uniref:Uncharacterized protein n=1 Tax=Dichomitus squalens TaxID=114155 RepID=A0A4Q9MNW4_9APHY|nr:hypothetical protein BD311DRAFT_361406 [Dichomitus squalens]
MPAVERIGLRAICARARFRAQRRSESAGSVTRLEGPGGIRTRAQVPNEIPADFISDQTFGFHETARFGPFEFPPTAGSAANLFDANRHRLSSWHSLASVIFLMCWPNLSLLTGTWALGTAYSRTLGENI